MTSSPPGEGERQQAGGSLGEGWERDTRGRVLRGVVVAAAIVGQLIVLVPFTVGSGLMAPWWAVAVLVAVWAAAAVGLVRLARTRPFATPIVPIANFTLWWLLLTIGERFLGWTA